MGLQTVAARGCEIAEIAVEGCFLRAFVIQLPQNRCGVNDGVGVGVDHLEAVALIKWENNFFLSVGQVTGLIDFDIWLCRAIRGFLKD